MHGETEHTQTEQSYREREKEEEGEMLFKNLKMRTNVAKSKMRAPKKIRFFFSFIRT